MTEYTATVLEQGKEWVITANSRGLFGKIYHSTRFIVYSSTHGGQRRDWRVSIEHANDAVLEAIQHAEAMHRLDNPGSAAVLPKAIISTNHQRRG